MKEILNIFNKYFDIFFISLNFYTKFKKLQDILELVNFYLGIYSSEIH